MNPEIIVSMLVLIDIPNPSVIVRNNATMKKSNDPTLPMSEERTNASN